MMRDCRTVKTFVRDLCKVRTVGGQNPGGVRGTPANTTKQEFGSRPGHATETANAVVDQQTMMTVSCSQNDPHKGHMNRTHEKARKENDSAGSSMNDLESERGASGTTVCESNPHGMAVGMKRENKENNTEQYGE